MISRYFPPFALATALLFAPAVLAQEATSPAALRVALSGLVEEQRTIEAQLATKREQLGALRNRPSPEQAELLEAEVAAGQARSELAANPSPEAQARLNNAEFKLTLAERKWSKSNPEVTALGEEIAALEVRFSERQQAEQQTRAQLQAAEQDASRRLARERAERERQEQELASSRREAEAAQAEIERLKALLAEQEAASQIAAVETAAADSATQRETALGSTPITATPVTATPVTATTAPATAETTTSGNASIRLATPSEVLAELRRLQQTIATRDDRERLVNDSLYAKRFIDEREVETVRIGLRALGSGQFRGSEQLPAGDYRLIVGFDEWPITLSAGDAGSTQVFLLDRSGEASRLVLYGEHLERSN